MDPRAFRPSQHSYAYLQLEGVIPLVLVKIQQHLVLKLVLSVVDDNRVVVSIQAVHQGRNRGTLKMPDVARRLSRLLSYTPRTAQTSRRGYGHEQEKRRRELNKIRKKGERDRQRH